MPDPASHEIARVASELEIRNLLARIAHLADRGDLDTYLSLMTPDVVWDMPENAKLGLAATRRSGRGQIAEGVRERTAAGIQGAGSDTLHLLSTVWVRIDGNRATSESRFLFYGSASSAPDLLSMGRYEDELRRGAEGWQLARRRITFGGA